METGTCGVEGEGRGRCGEGGSCKIAGQRGSGRGDGWVGENWNKTEDSIFYWGSQQM